MNILTNFFSKKPIYKALIPITLLLFGLIATLFYTFTYDAYIKVVPVLHPKSSVIISSKIFKDGVILKGQFVAQENNLGAIALQVKNSHDESVLDNFKVFFRIKEKNAREWHAENSYNGGQFNELELFPFGFSLIPNSKGKEYYYEIDTRGVNDKNYLAVNMDRGVVSEYLFDNAQLKSQRGLTSFVFRKFLYILLNPENLFAALIYFLPLYVYLFILNEQKKFTIPVPLAQLLLIYYIDKYLQGPVVKILNLILRNLKRLNIYEGPEEIRKVPLLSIPLFLIILSEIFLGTKSDNFLLLIIIISWVALVIIYKLELVTNYLITLFFLVFCFVFLLIGLDKFAEKAAIWAYLFLAIGAVHSLVSLRAGKIAANS